MSVIKLLNTEKGKDKNFQERLNAFIKKRFGKNPQLTEHYKQELVLETDEIPQYMTYFLGRFPHLEYFNLKNVTIGRYARKARSLYPGYIGIRLVVNLDETEVFVFYASQDSELESKYQTLQHGYAYMLSPTDSINYDVVVENNPIRPYSDETLTKIRTRNYLRTTLVYNFEMNLEKYHQLVDDDNNDSDEE